MGLIRKEILKKDETMEESIHEQQKAEFVYWCVRENVDINVIILRYIRNVNLPIPKGFRNCRTFTKTPFLNFRDRPKMAKETNKGDVESICIRVTKPASKRWRTLKFI